ncbi:nuclear transport factor 2 family protein [Streptomyces sp. NPDC020983]|uniref:nuclear transport factor 2 family protein n=1 Tax=Streptomyces sp. NPDC020983 TaxID=3365106 RepID=UPI0037B15D80
MTDQVAGPEAELREAERRLRAAVLAGDADALDGLLDDRVRYTGPDGGVLTKADDLAAHRSRTLVVEAFDEEELHVTVAGTTGVTYLLAVLRGTAAGEPFAARLRYTRTWVREGGRWRVLAAHAGVAQGG